ncbi:MAG: hypothetical protein CMH56_06915 [Myxococcales bacterium]|nr:hypothetical protein [Myxococcales bacterium]
MATYAAQLTTIEDLGDTKSQKGPEAFMEFIGHFGLLVRLDERGNSDEPTPWAFREGVTPMGIRPKPQKKIPATPWDIVDTADDYQDDPDKTEEITDELGLGFPIPPSRGAASVYLLPETDLPLMVTVGREDASVLAINERSISRKHATLDFQDDIKGLRVTDLKSRNGVKVRGRMIPTGGSMTVRFGDTLAFGDVVFLYLSAQQINKNIKYFID